MFSLLGFLPACASGSVTPVQQGKSSKFLWTLSSQRWSDRWEPKLPLVICKETSSSYSVTISRGGKGVFWNNLLSLHLPWCLKLPWCSISREQIGFPCSIFLSRYFPPNADKIYLHFVFLRGWFHPHHAAMQSSGDRLRHASEAVWSW